MNTTHADARLAEVKQRVATGDYVVDASLVADAMLEQVRLVKMAHRLLTEDSVTAPSRMAGRRSHRREAQQLREKSHAPARQAA